MTSDDTAQTPADLTIEVYTAPGRSFTSASPPQARVTLPTWSPSSATLIYGDHDAILVDTLITYDQVDALADWIETKGRRLSRIYITHGHGDHWLGLARLTQRFPGRRVWRQPRCSPGRNSRRLGLAWADTGTRFSRRGSRRRCRRCCRSC